MRTINEILIIIKEGLKAKRKSKGNIYFLCWIAEEHLTVEERKIFTEYLIEAGDNDCHRMDWGVYQCTHGWKLTEYKPRLKWLIKHIKLTKTK